MVDPDQSADQVADLQAQLDPTRSECIRPIVMEHLHRAMRAKSNTDKYHEYHALCVACLSYIDDEELKSEILKDLCRPDTNLSNDFIRNYKAEMKSGVPNYLILENEYSKLVPRIVEVWLKVLRALIEQDLIPWTLTYPEKILEGSLIDEVIQDIQMQKFRLAAPIREAERRAMDIPPNQNFMPVYNGGHYLDEETMSPSRREEIRRMQAELGLKFEEEQDVSTDSEEADDEEVLDSSEPTLEVAQEPDEEPSLEAEPENEPISAYKLRDIAEPELSRMTPLDPEPEKPAEEEREYTDEEIERGAEAIKKLLQERVRNARNLSHP